MANEHRYKPTISVITIVFNGSLYLEGCIRSVVSQTYESLEYLVVDGGSTDGSLEIIRKHAADIDFWISEPDKGIADAMNKGLAAASGDYIIFLHSDDYFLDQNVLEKAVTYLDNSYDIIMFNIILERNGSRLLSKPRGLSWRINFKTGVYHQSVICSKGLFQKIGVFDTQFRIAMDYDFFLRAYNAKVTAKHVDMPLSLMRLVGISSRQSWRSLKGRFFEERNVHAKNCTSQWMQLLYVVYWSLYLPFRKMRKLYVDIFA